MKNINDVLDAWHNNQHCRKNVTIWTNGRSIFSYDTCVLTQFDYEGVTYTVVNVSKYSQTTSKQVNAILSSVPLHFSVRVTGLVREITESQLADIGETQLEAFLDTVN